MGWRYYFLLLLWLRTKGPRVLFDKLLKGIFPNKIREAFEKMFRIISRSPKKARRRKKKQSLRKCKQRIWARERINFCQLKSLIFEKRVTGADPIFVDFRFVFFFVSFWFNVHSFCSLFSHCVLAFHIYGFLSAPLSAMSSTLSCRSIFSLRNKSGRPQREDIFGLVK